MKTDLLSIIVCPKCKGTLNDNVDRLKCLCCSIEFKVESGIPILIVED